MPEKRSTWPAGAAGMKRTRQREAVIGVLERADMPLNARDICERAGGGGSESGEGGEGNGSGVGGGAPMWLSTVYRVLEALVQKGVARKLSAMDGSGMALYELRRQGHKHYAVCVGCHKIMPMANCPMDEFTPKLSDSGFRVTGHSVEVYGYCGDCGGAGATAADDAGATGGTDATGGVADAGAPASTGSADSAGATTSTGSAGSAGSAGATASTGGAGRAESAGPTDSAKVVASTNSADGASHSGGKAGAGGAGP